MVIEETDDWEAEGFLQSAFWGRFKSGFGWSVRGFRVGGPDLPRAFCLSVLVRRLRGPYSFAYVPHGPELELEPGRQGPFLSGLAAALAPFLPAGCAFIRFDPAWHLAESAVGPDSGDDGDEPSQIAHSAVARPVYGQPLRKGADVQPPDTVVLDIARDDETLLAGMKPKWRYNIKLALKKGVTVSDEGAGSMDVFYSMYEVTSRRDGIALHPKAYYEALFRTGDVSGKRNPDLRLWVARHEGQPLAAIITLFHGARATYLYGASSDEKRNLMPAYALQWTAMRAAREAGCTVYDFYGIPPRSDPSHAMAGLYRFKTGFGGTVLHYAGSWDYPLAALPYAAFRAVESVRLFWHKNLKKKLGRLRA